MLPSLTAAAAGAALSPPRLPAAAAASVALARRAAALRVPVRLEVPVAGRRALLARALHARSDRPGPLIAGRHGGLHDLPAGASVLIDGDTLSPTCAHVVESLIDDGATWVLLAAARETRLPGALAARLAAVTIVVPPLRDRRDDLAALARDLVTTLSARCGAAAPVLTDAATEWLAGQGWPGDMAELEATLARALLRAGGATVDVSHLAPPSRPPDAFSPAPHAAQLELLVAQLAHELRNPLAAVKTFAQLPGLADDPTLRERFATVTDDAVARMDALLDNATAFARLATPQPVDVELAPLLDPLVGEIRAALAERAIALGYASPNGARCRADRDQLAFALRNVLAGVAHEAPSHDAVRIDATAPGIVRVDFDDRHGTTERLRRIVLADPGDPTVLSLPFTLARAVLERNGGGLAIERQPDGRALLELRLPGASADGG